jgi:hypothetical protein
MNCGLQSIVIVQTLVNFPLNSSSNIFIIPIAVGIFVRIFCKAVSGKAVDFKKKEILKRFW